MVNKGRVNGNFLVRSPELCMGGLGWSIVMTTFVWCISVRFDACSGAFESFSMQKLQKLDTVTDYVFHVALC